MDPLNFQSNLTLCDYFAVIGYDVTKELKVDKCAELASNLVGTSFTELPIEFSKSPLDCSYEANILSYFPKHRPNFSFVPEIALLCLPKGLRLYTERKVPKHPNFHSFVLIQENGSKINGCALIFYEPVLDEKIRQNIYDRQLNHIKQIAASNNLENINKVESDEVLSYTNQDFPHNSVTNGNYTLPRKTSLKTTSLNSERFEENQLLKKQHCLSSENSLIKKRFSFYDSAKKPIYISKCICFITRAPIVYSIENLLRSLYAMLTKKFSYLSSPILPIESIIYWALHEVPLPSPGTCLQVSYGECHLIVKYPGENNLPLFDYPIQILFNFISIEKFIKLFTCFMLEHQILLCSKFMDRLMLVAECLSTLIFPFQWQLTYVPILPYSQLKFIEAPVPYLMGFCYDHKIPDQIFQSNVCIFDIDTSRLDYPEDLPVFPQSVEIIEQITEIQKKFCFQHPTKKTFTENKHKNQINKTALRNRSVKKFETKQFLFDKQEKNQNEPKTTKHMTDLLKNNYHLDIETNENSENITNSTSKKNLTNDFNNVDNNETKCLKPTDFNNAYLKGLSFNQSIRELFLCNFASIFASYEHFIIGTSNVKENRESVVNFDKASFLSDQPESYLPFLAAFLETQMFASFVDAKILSKCQTVTDETKQILHFDYKINYLLSIVKNDHSNNCFNEIFNKTYTSTHYFSENLIVDRPLDYLFKSPTFINHQQEISKMDAAITADYEIALPHLLKNLNISDQNQNLLDKQDFTNLSGIVFPVLNPSFFEQDLENNEKLQNGIISSPWKKQQRKQRVLNVFEDPKNRIVLLGKMKDNNLLDESLTESPMKMAHQSWRFVEQLLKETKTKTKRMLVAKMGKEALHLGHGDLNITGVEENTLVAGFCDLLERIWAHGLKKKQGKSALWTNIFAHYNREKLENFKTIDRTSSVSPDFAPQLTNSETNPVCINDNFVKNSQTLGRREKEDLITKPRKRSLSRSRGVFMGRRSEGGDVINLEKNFLPLSTHMAHDLKNIMRMTEIKTDIGFARAFVRLALERKLLHKHLKAVLSDTTLLQKMYKRYAFLRCEEEREQFLYHVLSLNAVDFSCFTHTFISSKISYQVLLVASIDRFSSSLIWIMLAGSLNSTKNIYLPSNSLQFTFDYKNLGILSTLRIGHSASEKGSYPSKWFLEYVLVRNNITAQTFCFNCNRWFGRGVDDGASERLLVAENYPLKNLNSDNKLESTDIVKGSKNSSRNISDNTNDESSLDFFNLNNFISRPQSPISSNTTTSAQKGTTNYLTTSLTRRRRSPSISRPIVDFVNNKKTAPKISELQHKLGMSVNALVKHFFAKKDYRSGAHLTALLCGENGLVSCLEQVFKLGRQDTLFSNRFFGQPYPWDYIERVFTWLSHFTRNSESEKLTEKQRKLISYAEVLVLKISGNSAVGKEEKFHLFILVTLRDHTLSGLLPLMAWTPITTQIYDESAFLRQPHHLTYLSKLLNSLNEFDFTLEKSFTFGYRLLH